MKLYLPISSKNFSLIFETESVSPKAFYAQRTFGNVRFRPSSLDLSEDFLTLFTEPILFEFYEQRETYPMWLEFDSKMLSNNLTDANKYSSEILPNTIFLYPQTIYFNTLFFRCIFRNTQHLQDTKIDSESYRNVKTTLKYNITVEDITFFKKTPHCPKIQVPQNSLILSELEKDKRFNHFKGFLYGYAIGELNESSPEKNKLFSLFVELQSTFTNAKSQLIMRGSHNHDTYGKGYNNKEYSTYKSKFDYKPPTYNPIDSKNEILQLINEIEKLFLTIFSENKKYENDLAIEKANEILKILQQENADQTLISDCQYFINSIQIRNKPFELIKKSAKDFFRLAVLKSGLNAEDTELSERNFKSNLIRLQKQAEYNFLNTNKQPNSLDLTKFEFKSSFEVLIDNTKLKLSEQNEYILFNIIIAYLLENPRPSKQGEITRDEKVHMIQNIASNPIFKNKLGSKDNKTDYYNSFVALHRHFSQLSDFTYENIKSNVLTNFACFISKIDRFDELIEFVETKNIDNKKIAYGFWCAYNGFSEISNKNAKVIFASGNSNLINSFDNYLSNVSKKLDKELFNSDIIKTQKNENKQDELGFFSKAKNMDVQVYKNLVNSLEVTTTDEKRQDVENNSFSNIEKYLHLLKTKIWLLPTISQLNDSQKDDVAKGLLQTTEKITNPIIKKTDIFIDTKYICAVLKQSIIDLNKKRKKVEYKISEELLVKILQEIETMQLV
jgi:hypothetical protein